MLEVLQNYLLNGTALLATFLIIVWILVTLLLAMRVHRAAERQKQSEGLWTTLTVVFGIAGYAAYRIYDDGRSRRLSAVMCAGLPLVALLLVLWLLVFPTLLVVNKGTILDLTPGYAQSFTKTPSTLPEGITDPEEAPKESWWPLSLLVVGPLLTFFGPLIVFRGAYALLRPRITIEKIRARLEESGELVEMDGRLLIVENLVKHFPVRRGVFGRIWNYVKAVDGVSFELKPGETLGLVGESGCGKTTSGRMILALLAPTAGRVVFDGIDLSLLSPAEMRAMRRMMQLIFQDPFGSLNPRMTVLGIIGEALKIHGVARGRARQEAVGRLLERVGLDRRHIRRYPHEFSGGQRQRIGIARALALNPKFIVCDEPVSALDVSIQAQIINLLGELQSEFGLTYLFIAHDLSVVEHVSDNVAVMYLGMIAEKAPSVEIYRKPLHPYTMALLSAVPTTDPSVKRDEIILEGDPPSPLNPPVGCRFHTRCRYTVEACKEAVPELREIEPGHFAACIRAEEIQAELRSE